MFSPKFFIEQFQASKRTVSDQIFKDQPELKQMADNYVEAQTQFANMLLENSIAANKMFWDQVSFLGNLK